MSGKRKAPIETPDDFDAMMGVVITHFEQQKKMINTTLKVLNDFSIQAKTDSKTVKPAALDSMAESLEKQTKKRLRKMKKKVDPNKPKRPPSGYQLFMALHSGTYKEQHPEADQKDVMTVIAKRWTNASPEEKGEFNKQSGILRHEYEQKLKKYEDDLRAENGGVLPDMNNLTPEEIELRRALKRQRKEQRAIRERLQVEKEVTIKAVAPVVKSSSKSSKSRDTEPTSEKSEKKKDKSEKEKKSKKSKKSKD